MDDNHRILIVDDNLRARKALSACLSTLDGCQVVSEACNGQDALLEVERHAPDTVLMDVLMPVMDGLAATQAIKDRWPKIRVIILTLYAESRSRAEQTGADAFLVKGCSIEELTTAIRSRDSIPSILPGVT